MALPPWGLGFPLRKGIQASPSQTKVSRAKPAYLSVGFNVMVFLYLRSALPFRVLAFIGYKALEVIYFEI